MGARGSWYVNSFVLALLSPLSSLKTLWALQRCATNGHTNRYRSLDVFLFAQHNLLHYTDQVHLTFCLLSHLSCTGPFIFLPVWVHISVNGCCCSLSMGATNTLSNCQSAKLDFSFCILSTCLFFLTWWNPKQGILSLNTLSHSNILFFI